MQQHTKNTYFHQLFVKRKSPEGAYTISTDVGQKSSTEVATKWVAKSSDRSTELRLKISNRVVSECDFYNVWKMYRPLILVSAPKRMARRKHHHLRYARSQMRFRRPMAERTTSVCAAECDGMRLRRERTRCRDIVNPKDIVKVVAVAAALLSSSSWLSISVARCRRGRRLCRDALF